MAMVTSPTGMKNFSILQLINVDKYEQMNLIPRQRRTMQKMLISVIYHVFITVLLFLYCLTSIWYLQQFWSDTDDTSQNLSSITTKFTYSIRSWLLVFHLQ